MTFFATSAIRDEMAGKVSSRDVKTALSRKDSLPTLPATYTRLIRATSDANSNISDLVEIITYDPILAASVLRVANSAFTGLSDPVEDLSDAIMVLGVSEVSRIALSVGYVDLFKVKGPAADQLRNVWMHSVTTALFSWRIASLGQCEFSNDAFLAGLLHDIGKLFFATAFTDAYGTVLGKVSDVSGTELEAEQETFGMTHSEAGEELCRYWKLSPRILGIARWHHEPDSAPVEVVDLAKCVGSANILAHEMLKDRSVDLLLPRLDAWMKHLMEKVPHPELLEREKLKEILSQELERGQEFVKSAKSTR